MKVVCLLWGPFGFRMDELAEVLGGKRISITLLYGPRYLAPLRYAALALRSLILLLREHPDVIYSQNPPIFCPLTCLLYCRAAGRRLIVDHHSVWSVKTVGTGPLGKIIHFIERFVSTADDGNTVPHSQWATEFRRMGASSVLIVHDFVPKNRFRKDNRLLQMYAESGMLAIAAHGGHPLEKLETEVQAAAGIKSLTLVISGPEEKISTRLRTLRLPQNVKYVGFLPRDDYERLKVSCDFAVNITDEPYTLSHVLLEFAASSLAIISSRQIAVVDLFGDSILYVDSSSVEEVRSKMTEFVENPKMVELYRSKISQKYDEIQTQRGHEAQGLRNLVLGEN
jgi:glycosyltransferase involved in cell wall biosynthesis